MIPKIIHYCWFGSKPIPKLERECMESWRRMLPDYKIMRWDETTFDVDQHPFTAAAYKAKKFAFVADYVRLYALHKYGGVYLDTDIEIVKSLDDLMEYEAFGGFETPVVMQTGVLAMTNNNVIFKEFFEVYQNLKFELKSNGEVATLANSHILARILSFHGLKLDNSRQSICGMELFPQEYFCPINQATREIKKTENTYCIHYLSGSWFPRKLKVINSIKRCMGRWLGYGTINKLRELIRG